MPLPFAMLVAVCSAYTLALDPALEVRAIHSASKSQWSSSLRVKENVLLVNRPFQLSLLTRTLVMTSDSATLLRYLHDLRAVPAIRPFEWIVQLPATLAGGSCATTILAAASNRNAKQGKSNFVLYFRKTSSNCRSRSGCTRIINRRFGCQRRKLSRRTRSSLLQLNRVVVLASAIQPRARKRAFTFYHRGLMDRLRMTTSARRQIAKGHR